MVEVHSFTITDPPIFMTLLYVFSVQFKRKPIPSISESK